MMEVDLLEDVWEMEATQVKKGSDARLVQLQQEREKYQRLLIAVEAEIRNTTTEATTANYGYTTKWAGTYLDASSRKDPPPSVFAIASTHFLRELKECQSWLVERVEQLFSKGDTPELDVCDLNDLECLNYQRALLELELDNGKIWERERAREAIDAPAVILIPYYVLCLALDVLYKDRPIQRFWVLETVARIPYESYVSMLQLYESLGWWRVGADLKRVHFAEEDNEFHHLLVMEALGGDQSWADRFIAYHAALVYSTVLSVLWLLSPTLAYNFSELIEAHAVDTYGEFV